MKHFIMIKRLVLITALVVSSVFLQHSATLQAQSSVTCGYGNNSTTFDNCLSGAGGAPQKALVVAGNGNVGIGTTDPQSALHISTTASSYGALRIFNPTTNGEASLAFSDADGPIWGVGMGGYSTPNNFYIGSDSGPKVMIKDNGNVGIGITNPTDKLHVSGHIHATGSLLLDGPNGQNIAIGAEPGVNEIEIATTNPAVKFVRLVHFPTGNHMGLVTSHLVVHNKNPGDQTPIWFEDGSGIHWEAGINLPNSPAGSFAIGVAAGARMFVESNGKVTMESLKLFKEAEVGVLKITGGADLAEPFDMTDRTKIEPGMVVAIDPDHPGQLRLAKTAYDRMVAGVVSGAGGVNSGLLMQQAGSMADGEHPVALTGRVYVWVDASKTPVNPGDLLTTSATPGHAMKVTNHDKAQGAILGKAMSKLTTGKGLVLVLVTLQ